MHERFSDCSGSHTALIYLREGTPVIRPISEVGSEVRSLDGRLLRKSPVPQTIPVDHLIVKLTPTQNQRIDYDHLSRQMAMADNPLGALKECGYEVLPIEPYATAPIKSE